MSKEIIIPTEDDSAETIAAREKHKQDMIDKAAGIDIEFRDKNLETKQTVKLPAEGDTPARPDNVPDKFWNQETGEIDLGALLKSESEGQAEITRLRQGKPDDEPKDTPKADDEPTDDDTPSTPNDAIASARTEYATDGKLSDGTYEALAATGITREMVDGYISSNVALVEGLRTAAFEVAGSETDYNKMTAWALDNLEEGDIAALNTLLTNTDPEVVKRGAAQLKERFEKKADIDPDTNIRGGGEPTTGSYFKSRAEMTTAMKDPRYKTDTAYQAEVAQKIARASKAGVNLMY